MPDPTKKTVEQNDMRPRRSRASRVSSSRQQRYDKPHLLHTGDYTTTRIHRDPHIANAEQEGRRAGYWFVGCATASITVEPIQTKSFQNGPPAGTSIFPAFVTDRLADSPQPVIDPDRPLRPMPATRHDAHNDEHNRS